MPSINALRSFDAAARHLSFKEAAAELSVSPAAIGYQVKRLEEDFGRALFLRKHRAIELTPEGLALSRRLSTGFAAIEAAWTDARMPKAQETIRVSAPIAVVQKWLYNEPTLNADPAAAYKVEWDVSQAFRALQGAGIDAAIRYTATPDPEAFAEPLLRQCYTPLMRADMARTVSEPADLLHHGLIDLGFDLAAEPDLNIWKAWCTAQGLAPPNRFAMTCGYTMSAVEMARETGHIAMGGFFVVAEDIAAGRLVAPFDVAVVPQSQLWIMCRKGREDEPMMRWFRAAAHACAARLQETAAHLTLVDLNGQRLPDQAPPTPPKSL
ncbi:LysR family transcriptional regulator [Gymnodinialimonas sp. 57CJ19]|uniref:LysR family transcriptional regulator n=1 Tax=Gymnodinialimonas sp. 57CJ19 TaxID=3138498 RepID=UPI0031345678